MSVLRLKIGDIVGSSSSTNSIPCVYDTSKLINPHMVICGKTGSGKSHILKRIFKSCGHQPVRVHVMDPHGDLGVDDPSLESVATFSNSTQLGFNPLEINTHEHTGGVRTTINYFISLLESVDRKLQVRQKNLLRSLLEDLYANRGIIESDRSTWSKKIITPEIRHSLIESGQRRRLIEYYPTLEDLIDFASAKYQSVFGLGDSKNIEAKRTSAAIKNLRSAFQKIRKIKSEYNKVNDSHFQSELTDLLDEIDKLKTGAKESFCAYIDMISTGDEAEDMINYEYKETFSSIIVRLKDLKGTGVFSGNVPAFDPQKSIWRYNIQHLPDPEKQLLVYYVMNQLFNKRRESGEQPFIRDIIVVDETHKYLENDNTNIFSRIANEARKFGLGLWCASQNPEHFPQDFLVCVATKILLGIDNGLSDKISKLWDISKSEISSITPKETCAVYMDRHGVKNPRFSIVSVSSKVHQPRQNSF